MHNPTRKGRHLVESVILLIGAFSVLSTVFTDTMTLLLYSLSLCILFSKRPPTFAFQVAVCVHYSASCHLLCHSLLAPGKSAVLVDLGLLLPLLIRDLGVELQQTARRLATTLAATLLWESISDGQSLLLVGRLLAVAVAGTGLILHDYWERRNFTFGICLGGFVFMLSSIYKDILYILLKILFIATLISLNFAVGQVRFFMTLRPNLHLQKRHRELETSPLFLQRLILNISLYLARRLKQKFKPDKIIHFTQPRALAGLTKGNRYFLHSLLVSSGHLDLLLKYSQSTRAFLREENRSHMKALLRKAAARTRKRMKAAALQKLIDRLEISLRRMIVLLVSERKGGALPKGLWLEVVCWL